MDNRILNLDLNKKQNALKIKKESEYTKFKFLFSSEIIIIIYIINLKLIIYSQ